MTKATTTTTARDRAIARFEKNFGTDWEYTHHEKYTEARPLNSKIQHTVKINF